jgi:2-polyprenyl-3-methyl-5-hydroxy-6-metoxy-1,4-benzoquinol methylase
MGIFVYGATKDHGFDATGIDINKHAINRAKSTHPNIADKFIHSNFLRYAFEEKYHTLVCSDVVSNVSDPIEFLKKCNDVLDDNGNLFISCYDFGNKVALEKRHQWDFIGTGEIVTFFSLDTMKEMLSNAGFEVVDDYNKKNDVEGVNFLYCRKVKLWVVF